jgi:hypothetical protein
VPVNVGCSALKIFFPTKLAIVYGFITFVLKAKTKDNEAFY